MALQLIPIMLVGGLVGAVANKFYGDKTNEINGKVDSDRGSGKRSRRVRDQATGHLEQDGDEGKPPIQGDESDEDGDVKSKVEPEDESGQGGSSSSSENQGGSEECSGEERKEDEVDE